MASQQSARDTLARLGAGQAAAARAPGAAPPRATVQSLLAQLGAGRAAAGPPTLWCPARGPPCVAGDAPALDTGIAVEFATAAECASLCAPDAVRGAGELPLGPEADIISDDPLDLIFKHIRQDPRAFVRISATSRAMLLT